MLVCAIDEAGGIDEGGADEADAAAFTVTGALVSQLNADGSN